VIVLDVRRYLNVMVEVSKDSAKATTSTVKFLIIEHDQMAKDLQESMQRKKKYAGSTMKNMKK